MRLSKCDESLANDRNKLNFSLIGDPALTFGISRLSGAGRRICGGECGRRNERLSAGESR